MRLDLSDGVLPSHGTSGASILVIERLYFDDRGRAVELAINYFHPDRYRYEAELRRVR